MPEQHADGGLTVPPLLSVCAAELLERVDVLADDLFRTITAEIPPYARLSREVQADVRDFNERNLYEQLTCMADRRPMRTDSTRQCVRRRATQGVPVDAVLHAFRIGYRLLAHSLIDRAKEQPGTTMDDIAQASMSIWSLLDAASQTVNDVYRETLVGLARADELQRLLLLDALLNGKTADWAMLGGTGASLGLPEQGPYICVVAEHSDVTAMEQALLRNGLRSAWRPRPDGLAGIVALPDPAVASGPSRVPGPALVLGVVGAAVVGRAGLSPAYGRLRESADALRLATLAQASLPAGTHRAVTLDHDPAAALVAAGHDLALRLAVALLGPVLAAPDRKDLMETLTAWLDSDTGSTTEIAETLYCHRNTVRNRLDRVSRLTGRSLFRPADVAAFYASVRALELRTP
ncbi:helix-turn-helix domain-containing protein [Streptomyces poriferorum]|uniref:Helix-turn-helix domain-containing protein n=1 Tax=Streptomyces poriferorum TaxID=2798799 RepID=A0ABY9J251_9ACTN|nr:MULTISPECIES: helix-turn-helix domain-containing protein [unclassified Streptomyces]MDP5309540.1 helix-turn-helix domain-containing protein [Streptomyces sp. Alt4]WLQ46135.1 helix-turn-helix domain-containing protein [Streptomyces sp. Alt1]WLQ61270.1 helix-turn-helix domain-containing protein [Streptomyces sp. Alt2]WSI60935.1 helix-turn-helix domain-containing protein [Streptomyces sp. NBC_01336]